MVKTTLHKDVCPATLKKRVETAFTVINNQIQNNARLPFKANYAQATSHN